jgi:aconitate hydratase
VASALQGVITDPRTVEMTYPRFIMPESIRINREMLVPPAENGHAIDLEKGPNIKSLPSFAPLPDVLEGPVLLKVGDDISTDEIMPAGSRVLPLRSNIPEISKFVFAPIDESYYERAMQHKDTGSFVVGGANYGQGSSREHAALAPRFLGLRAVIVKSFARIHWQNLVNFGILPLTFDHPEDWEKIAQDDILSIKDVRQNIESGNTFKILNRTKDEIYPAQYTLSPRQAEMVLAGSLINIACERLREAVDS